MSTTKSMLRSIKNVTNGYSAAQIAVRECTSNDPTSPTIHDMSHIADLTYKNGHFQDVMDIIDKRLNDKGKNWRHVAKALTLLEYLVRYGSDDVILWSKDNMYLIKTLREFNTRDYAGNDQGSIIRVKAKELTSLLLDDERLKQEREAAQASNLRGRRRRNERITGDNDDDIYDDDLQKALEQSRLTAEEEAAKRREQSDESLERAIQLSLEEDELRKRNQNLLDLDDNPPDVYGYYQQQQQQQMQQPQGQIIGYDMFGNPVYANQPMATGYLQNAYQDLAAQQLAQQQLAQQQALYLQQQQLYQQQLAAANQQFPLQTGSNNPFARQQFQPDNDSRQQELQLQQQKQAEAEQRMKDEELAQQKLLLEQQQQRLQQMQQQSPLKQTPTGNQRMTEQYSELNQLLAQGTGIDTFGNTGETRIPAQFTKTGTFINSQGTGYKQVSASGNPFLDTQFTGMPAASANIVPSETGYGFGNQSSQSSLPRQQASTYNPNSLIDL